MARHDGPAALQAPCCWAEPALEQNAATALLAWFFGLQLLDVRLGKPGVWTTDPRRAN